MIPISWKVPVKIPVDGVLSLYMEDSHYRKAIKSFKDIEIVLHFVYSPADPEVGIMHESIDYEEWSLPLVGNYPDYIIDSVDKYLSSIDVEDTYGGLVREEIERYMDRLYDREDY